MLRISKLTDYGSVILVYMARHRDQVCSAATLSRALHLPAATVSKLLKQLKKNGIVKSRRGKNGGYSLARSAEQVSLAQIISVFEGPIALTECSVKKNLCHIEGHCAIASRWQTINQMIYHSLTQVTLQTMLETNQVNTSELQPLALIEQ